MEFSQELWHQVSKIPTMGHLQLILYETLETNWKQEQIKNDKNLQKRTRIIDLGHC